MATRITSMNRFRQFRRTATTAIKKEIKTNAQLTIDGQNEPFYTPKMTINAHTKPPQKLF